MPVTYESECPACGGRVSIVEKFSGALVSVCTNNECPTNRPQFSDELTAADIRMLHDRFRRD